MIGDWQHRRQSRPHHYACIDYVVVGLLDGKGAELLLANSVPDLSLDLSPFHFRHLRVKLEGECRHDVFGELFTCQGKNNVGLSHLTLPHHDNYLSPPLLL